VSALRVVVLRDPKESARKCSLTPLRGRSDVEFVEWRGGVTLDADGMTLLHVEGQPLSREDGGWPLLLLDASWKKVGRMARALRGTPRRRSIPEGFVTAYPRRSKTFPDPASGLASVEALFAASVVLGVPDGSLLDGYPFARTFLARNADLLARFPEGA
jgi:pre-rRNA-processing protein TSR3